MLSNCTKYIFPIKSGAKLYPTYYYYSILKRVSGKFPSSNTGGIRGIAAVICHQRRHPLIHFIFSNFPPYFIFIPDSNPRRIATVPRNFTFRPLYFPLRTHHSQRIIRKRKIKLRSRPSELQRRFIISPSSFFSSIERP
uniref:Uncharacterized protein n=1 Tax=Cucumis sativus TaxID=3659 RepID=A0A0A0L729_CUCSA